jgi:hypothetical protein
MPDAGSQYFGKPTTEESGSPPAKGNVLTQKMGPLPVWGWGAVALGAVLIGRKLFAGSAAAQSKTQTAANYPQGGVGGVFLLPGQGGGAAGAAPAPTPGPPGPSGAGFNPTPDTLRAIGHSLILFNNTVNPQPLSPEGQAFLHSVASSPDPSATEDFITQNVARKALNLPYIVGAGSWGNAGVLDPATGQVTALNQ